MSQKGLFRAFAVGALLIAGCGSTSPGAALPSPSSSLQAASPRSPLDICAAPSNRCFALVTVRGSNAILVRDVTDISHAATVATLGSLSATRFASSSEISYIDYDAGTLVRMPFGASPKVVVASSKQFAGYVDWSPDGSSVVYLTSGDSDMTVHQFSGGRDRVLSQVPAIAGVGCESVANCPTDVWDVELLYARDGSAISFVNSVVKPAFRLWSADGKLLRSSDSGSESMSVWSGGSLYFRDANGVEVWRNGVVSPFLPGIAWIRPKASPGGGQIVYEVRDAERWSHAYVVDTTTRNVRDLGKAHAEPAFLTSRYIWYLGERACEPADGCGSRVAGVPSGTTYIYDLTDGTETPSIITGVSDVWPHAA